MFVLIPQLFFIHFWFYFRFQSFLFTYSSCITCLYDFFFPAYSYIFIITHLSFICISTIYVIPRISYPITTISLSYYNLFFPNFYFPFFRVYDLLFFSLSYSECEITNLRYVFSPPPPPPPLPLLSILLRGFLYLFPFAYCPLSYSFSLIIKTVPN